jgi:hypothetical protein
MLPVIFLVPAEGDITHAEKDRSILALEEPLAIDTLKVWSKIVWAVPVMVNPL